MLRTLTRIAPAIEITVYALIEPGTDCSPDPYVRYVGQTDGPLRCRLSEHIADAKASRMGNEALRAWILGLLKRGRRPVVVALEVCTSYEGADLAEARQIAQWAAVFPDLFNLQHNPHRRQERPFTKPYLDQVL